MELIEPTEDYVNEVQEKFITAIKEKSTKLYEFLLLSSSNLR